MLNVRKLKQDFSQNMLKEGKELFENEKVLQVKILHLDVETIRLSAKVEGQFGNTYESEIEIDRSDCEMIDSNCDCPYHYDCQHLAAVLFYLEVHLDAIIVEYSKENDLEKVAETSNFDDKQKEELFEVVKEAVSNQEIKVGIQYQKEILQEYISASKMLAGSPFFVCEEKRIPDFADILVIFFLPEKNTLPRPIVEMQFALRLPSRSKPLYIPSAKDFLEGIRHEESVFIGGKKYLFTEGSFKKNHRDFIKMLMDFGRVHDKATTDRGQKSAFVELKTFGLILSHAFDIGLSEVKRISAFQEGDDYPQMPFLFRKTLENPLKFSPISAQFEMFLEYIDPPAAKILLNPKVRTDQALYTLDEIEFFECAFPGMLKDDVYYRFSGEITRKHLSYIDEMRDLTIPEPLFGTFIENALPELHKFAKITNEKGVSKFSTIPYVDRIKGKCILSYLDGELEGTLEFEYEGKSIPGSIEHVTYDQLMEFVKPEGILARPLGEEKHLTEELFQDFSFDEQTGSYITKSEKKIVEFMTETLPKFQDQIHFDCPQNLLDQFIYDQTTFTLKLSHLDRMDMFQLELFVDGNLTGVKMNRLFECVLSKKAFIELEDPTKKDKKVKGKMPKILVLDLEKISKIVQFFDELGIEKLVNHKLERPLWSLANMHKDHFKNLPVSFSITKKLEEIQKQMLGEVPLEASVIPTTIAAELRPYQCEGVYWIERLRSMYLAGILADDMGLGKTLQAIVSLTQYHQKKNNSLSIVVCPTSLLYNWKEEIARFNPSMKMLVIDGIPSVRKKLIDSMKEYDMVITSYSLMQKDVDLYKNYMFDYIVLDEAQHIKNRGTRNAKSVKMLKSAHKLILSGTPIENSLEELWSLFDFLMPGFLGSYDRFIEKYIRIGGEEKTNNLEYLKKKVAPFIMRRMKKDVLKDLPPMSELVYHCKLTEKQQELYKSYALSAKEELTKLVERDGFDKVHIHVLATLTRLKQICCHPAIFAKETSEEGDSAKYEMLMEMLQTLIEGGHKTVIFSQYTKMLQIIKNDLTAHGIRFSYLDGTSKNRLDVVREFNEDASIPVFLVSLKAGGVGLNLTGADTVIHYDMWWNPAVETQATDRVYRMGQKQNVSVYKLVTLSSIEEKIMEMQRRKKGLVTKVVSSDEAILSSLTWEEVLELLDT